MVSYLYSSHYSRCNTLKAQKSRNCRLNLGGVSTGEGQRAQGEAGVLPWPIAVSLAASVLEQPWYTFWDIYMSIYICVYIYIYIYIYIYVCVCVCVSV